MFWDAQKVLANIRQADTDDLLDRVTVFRHGMEADALDWIEDELRKRGVTLSQIAKHQSECDNSCLLLLDGTAAVCSFCRKPAILECWGWHKLLRKVPIFPRRFRYCKAHAPWQADP